MQWIDSRDLHRFEKHCFTKSGNCSLSRSKHFERCPPTQCSTYPALFVYALTFVPREQPSSSLIRDSGLGVASSLFPPSRTARTKVGEPSCSSPCQASCSRQLFSLSQTTKRIPCTIDDSRGHIQQAIFTEPDMFPYNFMFHRFVVFASQFASRSCGHSINFSASVNHAFVLIKSD